MDSKACTISVEGIVQRVGFRRFAERTARKLGLSGYVQNIQDGTVRVFIQGNEASIDNFVNELKSAPSPILVENVITKASRPNPKIKRNVFQIKSGPLAMEMQEGFGSMESQFADYRADFRDYRNEFRDYRQEFRSFADRTDTNFKNMDQKYGEISAKLAEILEALRTENRQALDELKATTSALVEAVHKLPDRIQ